MRHQGNRISTCAVRIFAGLSVAVGRGSESLVDGIQHSSNNGVWPKCKEEPPDGDADE